MKPLQHIESRPGYKLTKLGWIPKEWELTRIKSLGKIFSGSTPLRAKYNEYFNGGTIYWVKTTDLNNEEIITTEELVTPYAIKNTSLKIFPTNTVLVAMYGGFNQIGRTGILKINSAINQALSAIPPNKEKIDPIYLLNWFNYNVGRWKNFAASSRKDPNITKRDVEDFPILLPSLPEQRAIARILSTWDRGIATLRQLIAAQQQRKKGLMQQLLTGKVRVKGFEGEWGEFSYGILLKEVKRKFDWGEDELYELISVRRRSGGLFHRESLYGHQIKTKNLTTAYKGDFLISKMQIVHGASGLTTDKFDGMKISGSYIAVTPRDAKILNIEFFNWLSKLPYFYHQTYISSYGVHIEKMTFDFKSFLKLKVLVPSIEEQTAITHILQSADREIELLEQKLTSLQAQKKGLMQQLLMGKVRVKGVEKEG